MIRLAKRKLIVDKTELILTVIGKKRATNINLTFDQIQSIHFEKYKQFRFFRYVISEKIVIYTPKHPEPIVFTQSKHKLFFDEYKLELEQFARKHKITFKNDI